MSRIELVLPRLGESVEEGTITVWHVDEGQAVRAGEVLLEVSTDKVETEIEAPTDCTVEGISAAAGTTVQVGERLAWLVTASTSAPVTATPTAPDPSSAPEPEPRATVPDPVAAARPSSSGPAPSGATVPLRRAAPLSPVVRRLLAEAGLRPGDVDGSGQNGRITKHDVIDAVARRGTTVATPQPIPAGPAPANPSPRPSGHLPASIEPTPQPVVSSAAVGIELLETSVDLSPIDSASAERTACLTFALLRALESHRGVVADDAPIIVDGKQLDVPFSLRARAIPGALATARLVSTDAPVSIWDLSDEAVTRATFTPTAAGALLSLTIAAPRVEIRQARSGANGTIAFTSVSTVVAAYRPGHIDRRTALAILTDFGRRIEATDWCAEMSGA